MILFIPKETQPGENRAALSPQSAKKLVGLGLEVKVQSGAGEKSGYLDNDYEAAGAQVEATDASIGQADMVARIRKPSASEITKLKPGCLHLSFLDPFNESALIDDFAQAGVSAVSMEMIPRTTLAQKMDALSSQANLAGYYAVIKAAERLDKILPMMMTPAGTISPAKFFIIGVGVAGLQAIATAKRLGARVEAFDTRPVVEEQVKSLGAKFVKIDLGDTGQTAQGYAKALTPEQIAKQQQEMAKICASADVVITTAKLFGRKAPTLVTNEMMAGMRSGSIVVDLAVESGGNVEGCQLNEAVVRDNGVIILGLGCFEGEIPRDATQVYASNIASYIEHFWDSETKSFDWRMEDEILKGSLITHGGEIVHERFAPEKPAEEATAEPAAEAAGETPEETAAIPQEPATEDVPTENVAEQSTQSAPAETPAAPEATTPEVTPATEADQPATSSPPESTAHSSEEPKKD